MSQLASYTEKFVRRIFLLRNCCTRIEKKFDSRSLRVTDVEFVYSSSFLSVCCQWESLLEEILFEVVCGEESDKKGNTRLASFNSRITFEKLLLVGGKEYIAISNLKKAEEIATIFVANGRPFSEVSDTNRTHIQQAFWIRNAIAHESSFARRIFREKVPGVDILPTSKRFPGAFLRHQFRVSPSQRRFELYFAAFQSAAREIAAAW